MVGVPRALRSLVAPWPPPPRIFDLGRVGRPLPPGGVGGGGGLFPPLGRAAIGRTAAAPTSVAVRAVPGGGGGGAHPLGGQGQDALTHDYHKVKDKTAVVRVLGGVHVVLVRVSAAAVLSVVAAGGFGAALASAGAVPPPAAAAPPAGGAWTLVVRGGRRRGRGPGGWRTAAAGGPAGAAGVPPAVPPAGGRPLPLVAAAPAHRALLLPVERAARAAALLTRERPRARALVALETVYVSGATRAAPAQRLRALLADLTGAQVHEIVDERLFGSVTAVTLASIAVAASSAAVATGATAVVLTLLRGSDPWGPALLGSRWRAQLSADAAPAEAAARCRRHLIEQVADLAARKPMPQYLRASLEAHYRGDLAAHAGAGGVVAASSAAARGGSRAASAAETAVAAEILAGGGAAASAAAHPAAAEPPSRHALGTAAGGAEVFASAAAAATTAATPGDSAEWAAATAATAAISAGGGAAAFTAAPSAAARPSPRHVSTPWRGGRRFHVDGGRRDVGGLARRLGRVCGGRRRRRRRFCGRGSCGVRRRSSCYPPALSPPHVGLGGGAGRLPRVAGGSRVGGDEPRWLFGVGGGIRRRRNNFGRRLSHNNPRRAARHPPALPSAWNCDRGARHLVCRVGGGLDDGLVFRRQSRRRRAARRRRVANGDRGVGHQASPDRWRSRGYAAAADGCPLSSGRAGGPPPRQKGYPPQVWPAFWGVVGVRHAHRAGFRYGRRRPHRRAPRGGRTGWIGRSPAPVGGCRPSPRPDRVCYGAICRPNGAGGSGRHDGCCGGAAAADREGVRARWRRCRRQSRASWCVGRGWSRCRKATHPDHPGRAGACARRRRRQLAARRRVAAAAGWAGCGRQRGRVCWPPHRVTPAWLTRICV